MSGLDVQWAKLIKTPGEGISTGEGTIDQAIKDRDFWQTPALQAAKALKERPDAQKFNTGDEALPERCQEERRAVLELRPDRKLDVEPVEFETITHGHALSTVRKTYMASSRCSKRIRQARKRPASLAGQLAVRST